MKFEDKKKLAVDLMGLEKVSKPNWHDEYYDDGFFKLGVSLEDFNPDINPAQFKEVLERLTPEQMVEVEIFLVNNSHSIKKHLNEAISYFQSWLWISNHMPEVITAILEVI